MPSPTPGRLAVFGIDPHKTTHTVVALDALGRQVAQRTVAARTHSTWSCSPGLAPSPVSGSGRWRTAGTCLAVWSETCSRLVSGSCACRPS